MDRSLAGTGALVRWGVALFAAGSIAIAITFVGFADGDTERPLWQNLACLLAPIGLGLALIGLVRQYRADVRAVTARFAAAPVPLDEDVERQRLHGRIRLWMRTVAIAETLSWLTLIVATVVKYGAGWQLGVQVLGPLHGALFLVYLAVAVITWRALGWSPITLGVVLIESFVPGGGFLVARRADLRPSTDALLDRGQPLPGQLVNLDRQLRSLEQPRGQ